MVEPFVPRGRVCEEVHSSGFGNTWNQLLLQRAMVLLMKDHCWDDVSQNRKKCTSTEEEGASLFLLYPYSFLLVSPSEKTFMPT